MSQFPTGTTTYSPASLTEQERTDLRTEMGVVKTPSLMDDTEKGAFRADMGVAKTNGDKTTPFNVLNLTIRNTADNYQFNIYSLGLFCRIANGDGTQVFSLSDTGDLTITGSYSPFTGTHIATSKENLEIGELVSLQSKKLDDKQPQWEAKYCVASKKGVYGVVYDTQDDKYLIAAVGDAVVKFSNENGPCEAGDYLVPSATKKGCVMVHKGEFVPLNHCGKAGEATNEKKLIAWVKE